MDGCLDGTSGYYKTDESIERLRVIREDGTPLAAGKRVRIEATDYLARVFQHEIDHLNGVLFTDRALKDTLHYLTEEEEVERKTQGKRKRGRHSPDDLVEA